MHGTIDQSFARRNGLAKMTMGGRTFYVQKNQPTIGDVHVNRTLTFLSMSFQQDAMDFVADRVFPVVPVQKKTDLVRTYDRGFWSRNEMAKRAPGAETRGIGHATSTVQYNCDVYGLHEDIYDQIKSNSDEDINLDADAVSILTQMAMIRKEVSWASDFLGATTIWSTNRTGVASGEVPGTSVRQWNDPSSTPIEDIRALKTAMKELTGYTANKLVLGQRVYDALADHPDLVDRIKSAPQSNDNPAMVGRRTMAAVFEVPEILVMSAVQNTAAEGATNAFSFIGGKHALLLYTPPTPGLRIPSAGYTFSWTGYLGASSNGTRIKRFRRDESYATDRVEIECAFDQKLMAADLGAYFHTIVA